MEIDEVGILKVQKITRTFEADEFLQLSIEVAKVNQWGTQNKRILVLTNKRILLLDKSSRNSFNQAIRRKVPLKSLIGLTTSCKSFEFILHFSNEYTDDDLRLVSERRSKVLECLVKAYCMELNTQIPAFQVQDTNLKKYVCYKEDRGKTSKLPNVEVKFLFYRPLQEENDRRSQLNKIQQTTSNNKLLYTASKDYRLEDFKLVKLLPNQGSISQMILVENTRTNIQYAMKSVPKNPKAGCEPLDLKAFVTFDTYIAHPFLSKLECCFESDTKYFFVIQLHKGDLFTKIDQNLTEDTVKFYACEILLALEHLHERNLVYGDLKLENVLLDAVGHIQLSDFGYMRGKRPDINGVYATPEYIAPETLENYQVQLYYSDYWQLGILLYELTFQHPPFSVPDQNLLFDFIKNAKVVFPTKKQISLEFQDLLTRLLQKDPQNRIGYLGGVPEIQMHPWFKDINFIHRYQKLIRPPEWKLPSLMEMTKKK